MAGTDNTKLYFIYILTLFPEYRDEANWTDETRQIVSNHFQSLKQHTENGKVIIAGRTAYEVNNNDNFGIVVFEASSAEDAKQFMGSDPAVKQNVMAARLHPFSLALLRELI